MVKQQPTGDFVKSMARSEPSLRHGAKSGFYKKIDENGDIKFLSGYYHSTDNAQMGYWIYPIFFFPDEENNDTVVLNYLNNKLIQDRMLIGLNYKYNGGHSNDLDSIIENIISLNNLKYFTGENEFLFSNTLLDEKDIPAIQGSIDFNNRFSEAMDHKKSIVDTTFVSEFKFPKKIVFENDQFYFVFDENQTKGLEVSVDFKGKITSYGSNYEWSGLTVNLYAKKYPHPLMTSYNTEQQNDELKEKQKEDQLIEKALKN